MLRQRVFCLNNSFKVVKPIATQELLINEEIRDKEVRLIDEKGKQLGIVKIEHALRIADEKELDLVKIVPNANPPVCKIMDYGKARFEQIKREKEQRRNQTVVETKEIRLSSTIDTHDMEVKAKACVKFLKSGNKVKASIRFRGRQISHGSVGLDVMNAFYEMVRDPMPKIKTHRGAAKRFSFTKSGKIKRGKAYKSHILTKKTTKRTRNLRKIGYIAEEEVSKISKLIPYKR